MKYLCGVCMGFVLYIQCTPDTSTQFIVLHLLLFVFIDSCLGGDLQGFFFTCLQSHGSRMMKVLLTGIVMSV